MGTLFRYRRAPSTRQMEDRMLAISPSRLTDIVQELFATAGAPQEASLCVAEALVESNLMGHDSHGVLRVGAYLDAIQRGVLAPSGAVNITRSSATTAVIDGGATFGQVAARRAMSLALEKAAEHDVGIVALTNAFHTGRLGSYAVQAAEADCMGLVFGSGSAKGGLVAPYLGTSRLLNTNPMAWGVPAASHPPVFLDYATSMCAQGKIQAALDRGDRIPANWLLDAEGNPTTNPAEQTRGGVMLPFGLHKGYCLGFLIELVTNGLAGGPCAIAPGYASHYPTVLMAINIAAFQPLEGFKASVDELIRAAKAARRAPGVEEILVPGELEWRSRAEKLRNGLELPEATWQRLVDCGAALGLRVTA